VTALLVDTHVLLWLLFGDRNAISPHAEDVLSDGRRPIAISAVSVWEIAVKRSIGKLVIGDSWPAALTALGFGAMPVTALHAAEVEKLPWHHRDPFDRLLVAQATVEAHALVTADPRFGDYDVEVVW
jgi:PIN domain nuclease of toxin-antitoxin system